MRAYIMRSSRIIIIILASFFLIINDASSIKEEDLRPRIARISTWANNCALSCVSIFLVNYFITDRLTENAGEQLQKLFNYYYNVSLSVKQLRDFFASKVKIPNERQIILSSVLKKAITELEFKVEENNMLSDEVFEPLAILFDLKVDIHQNRRKEKEIVSYQTPFNRGNDTTLFPTINIYNDNGKEHYDLIMDTAREAEDHNRFEDEAIENEHDIPFGPAEEKERIEYVHKLVLVHYPDSL